MTVHRAGISGTTQLAMPGRVPSELQTWVAGPSLLRTGLGGRGNWRLERTNCGWLHLIGTKGVDHAVIDGRTVFTEAQARAYVRRVFDTVKSSDWLLDHVDRMKRKAAHLRGVRARWRADIQSRLAGSRPRLVEERRAAFEGIDSEIAFQTMMAEAVRDLVFDRLAGQL